MIKKILIALLLLLSACSVKHSEKESIYIDPVNDIFIFDELDEFTKAKLKLANGDKQLNNYQFKMLGKNGYQDKLVDIYNNEVDLSKYDKYILEIVSTECEHCKKLTKQHLNSLIDYGYQIIQYFNVGSTDEIFDFYNELDMQIPSQIKIISHNDNFQDYIRYDLLLEVYPTIISFVDNKVCLDVYGDTSKESIDEFIKLSFVERIPSDTFINTDGNNIIDLCRQVSDVEQSISKDNIKRLNQLDNDECSKEYTLKIIGSSVDFDKITNSKSDVYINEIDDFSYCKDKQLVLIFTYLKDESETNKVEFINTIIDTNPDTEFIVVLIEGLESSSKAYHMMNYKFLAPVTSVLGYIPDDFFKIGISAYPTALFIENATYTGVYSNIFSTSEFKNAISIFFGEDSIALKSNN